MTVVLTPKTKLPHVKMTPDWAEGAFHNAILDDLRFQEEEVIFAKKVKLDPPIELPYQPYQEEPMTDHRKQMPTEARLWHLERDLDDIFNRFRDLVSSLQTDKVISPSQFVSDWDICRKALGDLDEISARIPAVREFVRKMDVSRDRVKFSVLT